MPGPQCTPSAGPENRKPGRGRVWESVPVTWAAGFAWPLSLSGRLPVPRKDRLRRWRWFALPLCSAVASCIVGGTNRRAIITCSCFAGRIAYDPRHTLRTSQEDIAVFPDSSQGLGRTLMAVAAFWTYRIWSGTRWACSPLLAPFDLHSPQVQEHARAYLRREYC